MDTIAALAPMQRSSIVDHFISVPYHAIKARDGVRSAEAQSLGTPSPQHSVGIGFGGYIGRVGFGA